MKTARCWRFFKWIGRLIMKITLSSNFKTDVKKLLKKYKTLKKDLFDLIFDLKNGWNLWVYLWNNSYKIRLKNSDNNKWKSWWYRIITFLKKEDDLIFIKIFSKNDISSISEKEIDDFIKNLDYE